MVFILFTDVESLHTTPIDTSSTLQPQEETVQIQNAPLNASTSPMKVQPAAQISDAQTAVMQLPQPGQSHQSVPQPRPIADSTALDDLDLVEPGEDDEYPAAIGDLPTSPQPGQSPQSVPELKTIAESTAQNDPDLVEPGENLAAIADLPTSPQILPDSSVSLNEKDVPLMDQNPKTLSQPDTLQHVSASGTLTGKRLNLIIVDPNTHSPPADIPHVSTSAKMVGKDLKVIGKELNVILLTPPGTPALPSNISNVSPPATPTANEENPAEATRKTLQERNDEMEPPTTAKSSQGLTTNDNEDNAASLVPLVTEIYPLEVGANVVLEDDSKIEKGEIS